MPGVSCFAAGHAEMIRTSVVPLSVAATAHRGLWKAPKERCRSRDGVAIVQSRKEPDPCSDNPPGTGPRGPPGRLVSHSSPKGPSLPCRDCLASGNAPSLRSAYGVPRLILWETPVVAPARAECQVITIPVHPGEMGAARPRAPGSRHPSPLVLRLLGYVSYRLAWLRSSPLSVLGRDVGREHGNRDRDRDAKKEHKESAVEKPRLLGGVKLLVKL